MRCLPETLTTNAATQNNLVPVVSAWPFQKWAIDIMGPFPEAPGGSNSYWSRSIILPNGWKAKALAQITAVNVKKFLCDNGTKFANKGLQEWLTKLHINQVFTSVAHPQANGTNKKTSNFETPFSLAYGMVALIPVEIGIPSTRMLLIEDNERAIHLNLDLLEERRELAAIHESKYKRQLQKYYDAWVKICEYNKGDYVFRNVEASNAKLPGKLAPTWEGPYEIDEVLGKGTYKLKKLDGTLIP
ncbi:uncharacterized protein LOC143560236 [Bidens hawaiensis]|uniref:uncharacterized protein LOC143560236 n=1 Tax=Bidens hawaiensis TaxID=980011 RepID=UPI004049A659